MINNKKKMQKFIKGLNSINSTKFTNKALESLSETN